MDARKLATTSLFAGGILAYTIAIAPPMDAKVNYRLGDRVGSSPSWLVPQGAEFRSLEPGYGALKFPSALLGTALMGGAMCLARKFGAEEELRQKIKRHQEQVIEHQSAAEAAYQMALTQQRYKTLLEADQVAFEGQIETAYLESMGVEISTQPALPGTSLDQVTNPGDKVREAEAKPAIPANASDPASTSASNGASPGLPNLTWYPSVLVYGAPGAGKTTFAENEIQRRLQAGHKVVVLDPHAAYGAWKGCEVIGGGMDYESIDDRLKWFADEVTRRYKIIQSTPNPKFQPLTFVTDEFTNWASRCDNSGEFFQTAVSDIRKAEMFALIVSHTRTMPALGNAKGMSNLRDQALLEIELLGQQDPVTGKAVPRFEALVKLPGQAQGDRTLIKIPRQESALAPQQQQIDTAYLERLYSLEFNITPPTVSPVSPAADSPGYAESPDTAGDSGDAYTADTYPDTDWLPTQNQLLGMLQDTQLPPGRFIKEVLKATKPERYRTAKQAIVWLVRHRGDFKLMEKFKDLLS